MADLNTLIKNKHWKKIESTEYKKGKDVSRFLSDKELRIIKENLEEHVPIVTYGDGIELFQDFLHPDDAETEEMQQAATLLRNVDYYLSWNEKPETGSSLIVEAVEAAEQTLRMHGIEYHGFYDTLLFYRADGTHKQVTRQRVDILEMRKRKLKVLADRGLTSKSYTDEIDAYPWRVAFPLHWVHDRKHFGQNTAMDHALNILRMHKVICFDTDPKDDLDQSAEKKIDALARLAYLIGREHEALLKKEHEPDAIRGKKVLAGSQSSADIRETGNAMLRDRRFRRMEKLVPEIGADNAARQCELDGLGSWEAIKRQWNRNKRGT